MENIITRTERQKIELREGNRNDFLEGLVVGLIDNSPFLIGMDRGHESTTNLGRRGIQAGTALMIAAYAAAGCALAYLSQYDPLLN